MELTDDELAAAAISAARIGRTVRTWSGNEVGLLWQREWEIIGHNCGRSNGTYSNGWHHYKSVEEWAAAFVKEAREFKFVIG